jgi:hypothetical protein
MRAPDAVLSRLSAIADMAPPVFLEAHDGSFHQSEEGSEQER